ncbi:MAG: VWA domain-containing protein [Oscillospiraceae bacterium]|nr:VWA domain-containing protein [Oscillospiraceae bacterium]
MKLRKILSTLLAIVLSIGILTVCMAAATTTQDGLEVTLTTDKTSYNSGEEIVVTITVTNTNSYAVNNVTITSSVPSGYSLASGSNSTTELGTLVAGETSSVTVVCTDPSIEAYKGSISYTTAEDVESEVIIIDEPVEGGTGVSESDSVKKGINAATAIFAIIGFGIAVAIAVKYKYGRKLLSLLLCVVMVGAMATEFPITVNAATTSKSIYVTETVTVSGRSVTVTGTVSYSTETGSSEYYTVAFESNGGSEIATQTVAAGSLAEEPDDPTKDGFTFIGWYCADGYSAIFDFTSAISDDTTVYAKWNDDSDTIDSDGDGLSDSLEATFGTDPTNSDSDYDGMSDYYELNWLNTNPLLDDSDGNGIDDCDEDADGDGLTNGEEEALGLNPICRDSDYDGLSDYDELYVYGTDPLNDDTDGDGVNDGTEVSVGSNPLVAEVTFTYTESYGEVSEDTPVSLSVSVITDSNGAGTLEIEEVGVADNMLISTSIPGYLGSAYNLTSDGSVISATLTFEYDTSLGTVGEDFQPCVYYLNEEYGTLEEVPSTINGDGTVTAVVTHFSTYILLNKIAFDEVWENDIKASDQSSSNMTGIDVVFVIDSSGSMSSNDKSGLRKAAAMAFVDKLGENDRAAVIDFDSTATLYQSFTSDHDALYTAINRVNSSGGTNLSNGMKLAIAQFTSSNYTRQDAYKYIIFLTDGNGSYSTTYTTQAAANNIVVYTIGLGSGVDASVLTAIAEGTGGKYYFATSADTLSGIYGDISVETVDYSTDSNGDGISDYYTALINSGDLLLSSGSCELYGVTDMYGEDCDDWDGDGLKNGEEIYVATINGKTCVVMKTNPLLVDTDGDGFSDAMEISMGTSPTDYTQANSSSLKNLMNGVYVYEEYAKEDGVLSTVTKWFDWQKTDESKELLIEYFYDYASEETIAANSEAISTLESRETLIEALDVAVNFLKTAQNLLSVVETEDSNAAKQEIATVAEVRKEGLAAVNSGSKDKMDELNNKLGATGKSISLVSKVMEGVSEFSEYVEFVESLTSAMKAFSKLTDTKLLYVGDSLTKFAKTYQTFMDNKAVLGLKNSTSIGIVVSGAETALDIAEVCNTYGKIQANTEAFQEYIDLLEYIYKNSSTDYVRTAAGDIAAIVLDESWDTYYKQLNDAVGKEIGLFVLETALDLVGDACPYVKAVTTCYKIAKAAISIIGLTANAKAKVQAEVIYSISQGCVSYINSLVTFEGLYFSYSSDSIEDVVKYMTQLAQSRIVGENYMLKRATSNDVGIILARLFEGMDKDEAEDQFKALIKTAYERAYNLGLTLSDDLPYYSSYGNTTGGGGAW